MRVLFVYEFCVVRVGYEGVPSVACVVTEQRQNYASKRPTSQPHKNKNTSPQSQLCRPSPLKSDS